MDKVIVISSAGLGGSDVDLGTKLMGLFLTKLRMQHSLPDAMVFYNDAVKLLAEDSPHRGSLVGLHEDGVDIVACGTCLKYYGLDEDALVGRVTGMNEIVGMLLRASGVITL